jgi:glycyl-tRNA synthetase beta subunit
MDTVELREARLRAIRFGETLSADDLVKLLESVEGLMLLLSPRHGHLGTLHVERAAEVLREALEESKKLTEESEASDESESALSASVRALAEAIAEDGATRKVKSALAVAVALLPKEEE